MTQEERNAALAAIGGKQHVDALNDLLQGLKLPQQTAPSNGTPWLMNFRMQMVRWRIWPKQNWIT